MESSHWEADADLADAVPGNTPPGTEYFVSHLSEAFWQHVTEVPYQYDLFQLLRRIDAESGSPFPMGTAPLPRYEPIRLGQEPSLSFAPSTIAKAAAREGTPLHEITTYSFGLFGPNGPLPLHLTEYVRERVYHGQDKSMLAFCNLFHHRLTMLFYRAWADAQPTVSHDRPDRRHFENYLSSLIGLGVSGQLNRDSLHLHAKHFMAGHLIRQSRDPEGLQKILSHYFSVPVAIVNNIPHWLKIDRQEQARLKTGRGMPRLGQSAFLGIAIRDVQHKFRIELGPMSRKQYNQFLPGSPKATQLRDWVRQYIGFEYIWDIRLIMDKDDVKGTTLGGTAMLGLNSWMQLEERSQNTDDLIFTLETLESVTSSSVNL